MPARSRLFTQARWRRLLLAVAPVGRMALSNYPLQSVVLVSVFYGIGFGLFGQVSHAAMTALATSLFVAQVLLSSLWLRRRSYADRMAVAPVHVRQTAPARPATRARDTACGDAGFVTTFPPPGRRASRPGGATGFYFSSPRFKV
jgi:hypothetical protein